MRTARLCGSLGGVGRGVSPVALPGGGGIEVGYPGGKISQGVGHSGGVQGGRVYPPPRRDTGPEIPYSPQKEHGTRDTLPQKGHGTRDPK